MSDFSTLFDALLSTTQIDIPESHVSVDTELQTIGSFFDIESFVNDLGPPTEELTVTNDAPGYSAGAFELELNASLDGYGHVDPYYATGIHDPISVYDPIRMHVGPGYSTFEDIPAAPPLPYYGDVWGVVNLDTSHWQGLSGQQSVCVHPSQQEVQALQEISPAQAEILREPELTELEVTAVQPPARPCKRKARAADEELWPVRPKKTKCVDEDPLSSLPTSPLSSPSSTFASPSSSLATSPSTPRSPRTQSKLRPIVVEPPNGLHCPMAGCGVRLSPKDSAWRGHFRAVHHADLCANARAGSCTGNCQHTCPLPTHHKCAVPMAVDSIGRHFLNVHFELRHRCPVCGVEKAQRYSSCQRHIDMCAKKSREGTVRVEDPDAGVLG
ncbi:hypothetical protein C8Q73DRAFT_285387 [Cubamyces lactineus]|nr:hypothetical protein C8Q73DRAFT_285387 [Cubamyces lactineus]